MNFNAIKNGPMVACPLHLTKTPTVFLSARTRRVQAETESQNSDYMYVNMWVGVSAVISSSSSSPSSIEEGSSRTCVGAVPRDLSLYDIQSGIT